MADPLSVPGTRPLASVPTGLRTHATAPSDKTVSASGSFQQLLQTSLQSTTGLRVSGHAQSRLQERGIVLSPSDWNRIEGAVNRVSEKGAKDAYLMMGQVGLVVNVPNRTVITAMDHGPETIVTNIDSVVVV
jgi:flagellar operon protein